MIILPGGAIMAFIEACFDESGTHSGSEILCVAGYIVEKSQAALMDRAWRDVLAWKSLPCFHMADCAHGNGVFANLARPERVQIEARMIALIKAHTIQGVGLTVSRADFAAAMQGHPFYPDPYVLLTHGVIQGVTEWTEANRDVVEGVAYMFEAGHESRTAADGLLRKLFDSDSIKERYRHNGQRFVLKQNAAAVQAAGLLAWQWGKDRKNALEGRPRRNDLQSLSGHPHTLAHITPDHLTRLARTRAPSIRRLTEILGDDWGG